MYSVRSYIYSVSSYLHSVSSYLYSVRSYIYSVSSYLYSVTSYTSIHSHLILVSPPFCIQSHILCGRMSCRKYCHAADLEIINLN